MLGRVLRTRHPREKPILDPPSLLAIGSSSWTPAAAVRPAGAVLHLCILALVAAATVGAFFGIGLVMLVHQPAVGAHRGSTSAGAADVSAATTPARATLSPAAPPRTSRKSGPPSFPVQTMPSGELSAIAAAPAPVPAAPPEGSEGRPAPAATTTNRAAAASAAPPPDASQQPSIAEIAVLLARGDALFRSGAFASARLCYQQAFDAREGRGALGMGATYDPSFLNRGGRHGLSGDPAVATFWYRSALALGAVEADGRLAILAAETPR